MAIEPKIKRIYMEIQKQLFYMIPEKWSKVYLYSSIVVRPHNIQTGELYFYYIPSGILKKNPVNVYEIPTKFSIEDSQYLKLVDKLYLEIKRLQDACQEFGEGKWKSVVISIADFKFCVEYIYEGLEEFSSYEKHIIFRYKYLEYPIESFNREEKNIIYRYMRKSNSKEIDRKIYSEAMYEMPFETIKANSRNSNIQYVKEDDVRLLDKPRDIKSQILNSDF